MICSTKLGFLTIIFGFDKTCGIAGTDEAAGYQEFFWIPASFISHPTESKRLQKVHKVQKLQCHEIKVVQFNVHSPS